MYGISSSAFLFFSLNICLRGGDQLEKVAHSRLRKKNFVKILSFLFKHLKMVCVRVFWLSVCLCTISWEARRDLGSPGTLPGSSKPPRECGCWECNSAIHISLPFCLPSSRVSTGGILDEPGPCLFGRRNPGFCLETFLQQHLSA